MKVLDQEAGWQSLGSFPSINGRFQWMVLADGLNGWMVSMFFCKCLVVSIRAF